MAEVLVEGGHRVIPSRTERRKSKGKLDRDTQGEKQEPERVRTWGE